MSIGVAQPALSTSPASTSTTAQPRYACLCPCMLGFRLIVAIVSSCKFAMETVCAFLPSDAHGLLAELRQGLAQWSAGDLNQPLKRLVQLQDQEDRPGHGERTDEQGGDHGAVGARQETEADEDKRDPGNEHHQEGHGNRGPLLLKHQPARLAERAREAERFGLERTLRVLLRREGLERGVESPLARRDEASQPLCRRCQLCTWGTVLGPHLRERVSDGASEQLTGFVCFRAVTGQDAVEQNDVHGHLRQVAPLGVVGTLGRGNQQGQDQGRHGGHQPGAQLHDIGGIGAQMALGKRGTQQQPTQRPAEDAHEHERTDAHGTHDASSQPGVAKVTAGYPWKRHRLDILRIIAWSRHIYAEMPPARLRITATMERIAWRSSMKLKTSLNFWQFVVDCSSCMLTHGGLDEAPSFCGLSSKTARTRATSQPVFMSYKPLEIERPRLSSVSSTVRPVAFHRSTSL